MTRPQPSAAATDSPARKKAPPECVELLKYIVSADVQKRFGESGAGLPVTQGCRVQRHRPEPVEVLDGQASKASYVQLWLDTAYGADSRRCHERRHRQPVRRQGNACRTSSRACRTRRRPNSRHVRPAPSRPGPRFPRARPPLASAPPPLASRAQAHRDRPVRRPRARRLRGVRAGPGRDSPRSTASSSGTAPGRSPTSSASRTTCGPSATRSSSAPSATTSSSSCMSLVIQGPIAIGVALLLNRTTARTHLLARHHLHPLRAQRGDRGPVAGSCCCSRTGRSTASSPRSASAA